MSRGADALTDMELVAVILDDEVFAERLLTAYGGSLSMLGRDDIARLRMVEGLGLKRAQQLNCAAELGRRVAAQRADATMSITTTDDVVKLFRPQMESLQHEECWALYLTNTNRIIERSRISQGGVQGTVVDHRLIVKRALELLSTQIILVHNHPSGDAVPSSQDRILTDKIAQATALFDIRLLDHIIISRSGEYSFRTNGLLK